MFSNVIMVCNYAARYPGNFIASLKTLETELYKRNINIIYVFPCSAEQESWGGKV
jgi:hypothetical protein